MAIAARKKSKKRTMVDLILTEQKKKAQKERK
jgi:hypothetical protein